MKKRTSSRSRSRSRSRSHSPSHSREKKYPRSYQNNREFRGYHRGFRRPYQFRGRGRGYFQQRGRYQRGGYNNNNNFFRHNWKNYRQYPQQQQQHQHQNQQYQQKQKQQQQQQQNHSRGRSHSPKKRSGSPHTNHSHQSDRSSSPRSRHSHQSSSSSHSPTPKYKSAVGLARQSSKDVNLEHLTSKEVQGEGEGEGGGGGGGEGGERGGGGDEEPVEPAGVLAGVDDGSAGVGKPAGAWQSVADYNNSSPIRAGLLTGSADFAGQITPTTPNQSGLSPNSTHATSNGASSWKVVGKSPSKKSPTSMFLPFSKEDDLDGDTSSAISSAFKRFLVEQNNKKSKSSRENDMANHMDMEEEKTNGGIFDSVSKKYKEDTDVSLTSFSKAPPFEEEEGEVTAKPYTRTLRKEWDNGDEYSKPKITITRSTRGLFEERFGKCQNLAYVQVAKDDDLDLDAVAEEIYRSRKQDKAAAIAAALTKREIVNMLRELSPERGCFKGRRMEKSISSLTPSPPSSRRNSEKEMFMVRGDDSPPMAWRKREAKCNVRMDFLGDSLLSSSDILAEERQLSQDLVQASKKEQEFRSIFQHVKATQSQRDPSELFAQHIVTIVHHSKAQHFPPSVMTLNERFAMYQRRAAEKEMMKPRKSPEIHRRIDVSPSAFKKHSHLFEAMKGSEDASYKDGTEKTKRESMDLRLDIERRKKYLAHEGDFNQDGARDLRETPDSSKEKSMEKSSKHHKKSKKSKKKRSRSSSSSSSSSSHRGDDVPHHDEPEPTEEGFNNKARLGPQDRGGGHVDRGRSRGGFQFRIRGRGWNRGNYQGNNAIQGNSNPLNVQVQPKNEDWDPEYTPKSKKYYLHDDRDGEAGGKVLDARGRGRGSVTRGRAWFIIRKGSGGLNNSSSHNNSSKWAHDKFQLNGEKDGQEEEEEDGNTQPDHKQGGKDRGVENT